MVSIILSLKDCSLKFKRPSFGWITVFGGFLIHLTLGTVYSYGNMVPYIISYSRIRSQDPNKEMVTLAASPWLMGCGFMARSAFTFVGGWMNDRLGLRLTTVIGLLVLIGGTAASFSSIMSSYWLTVLTFGLFVEIGSGVSYMAPMIVAMKWFPDRKGLVSGLVISGLGLSSLLLIPLQTGFINPKNLISDYKPDSNSEFFYFSQSEVLDRVPHSFLLLAVIYVVLGFIGIAVMVEPENIAAANKERSCIKSKFLSILVYPWLALRPRRRDFPFLKQTEDDIGEQDSLTKSNKIQTNKKTESKSAHSNLEEVSNTELADCNRKSKETLPQNKLYKVANIKPLELLRQWDFYFLWFAHVGYGECTIYISSFYKVFGQGFIFDDHYLALVGTAASVGNCLGRILWGPVADRVSCKIILAILFASQSSLMYTFFSTSVMGHVGLLFWVLGFYLTIGGVASVSPVCIAEWYGNEHFSTNYGLWFSALVLSGATVILLSTFTHDVLSWSDQMFIAGSAAFLGLILLLVGGGRPKLVEVTDRENISNQTKLNKVHT